MNPMISSSAVNDNPHLKEEPRKKTESNLIWLNRVYKKINDGVKIVLIGGTAPVDFRLRIAQSHLRHDLTPSSWSHAFIINKPAKDFKNTKIYEISLDPQNGFGFPPPVNGLQTGTIKKYDDIKFYPNIATLSVPISGRDSKEDSDQSLEKSIEQFKIQRSAVDSSELIVKWLGFVWGVGKTSNPIFDGYGIPSAVMIEVITSSLGFELTPGISSNTSCPEAIWQSVKWWHKFYRDQSSEIIKGYYFRSQEFFNGG